MKRSIRITLQFIITQCYNLLSKLDKTPHYIEIVDIQSKSNYIDFFFRTNLPHTDALYQIRDLLNKDPQFIGLGDKVFTIQTMYSNKIIFSFCPYIRTVDGLITIEDIDNIVNKYTAVYLQDIYGSVEIFYIYRVTVRSIY